MKIYLYLSLNPEALIASHLPPEEFGAYLAVGTRSFRGSAMFFEVDPEFQSDYPPFPGDCDALPASYRRISPPLHLSGNLQVLEHVPVAALGKLHLATHDGRVLGLASAPIEPTVDRCFHLYQEFCPVTPRVVSTLDPSEFCARLTDPRQPVSVPRIVFAELTLGALATDLDRRMWAICLIPACSISVSACASSSANRKPTKVTTRNVRDDVLYRTVHCGFYVGQAHEVKFYPLPSATELDSAHHDWWRSAQASYGS